MVPVVILVSRNYALALPVRRQRPLRLVGEVLAKIFRHLIPLLYVVWALFNFTFKRQFLGKLENFRRNGITHYNTISIMPFCSMAHS